MDIRKACDDSVFESALIASVREILYICAGIILTGGCGHTRTAVPYSDAAGRAD